MAVAFASQYARPDIDTGVGVEGGATRGTCRSLRSTSAAPARIRDVRVRQDERLNGRVDFGTSRAFATSRWLSLVTRWLSCIAGARGAMDGNPRSIAAEQNAESLRLRLRILTPSNHHRGSSPDLRTAQRGVSPPERA